MTPVYDRFGITVHTGKCLNVLAEMPDAFVHSVVTDPPYGLEFMGEDWDSFRPSSARLRTRTDARTNPREGKSVCTTPEAYIAGQPFQAWCTKWAAECARVLRPGGHLLAFGGSRTWHRLVCAVEDAGFEVRDSIAWLYASGFPKSLDVSKAIDKAAGATRAAITVPATSAARQWAGWGTALKPAFEPIVVARKPLAGTVAGNVLEHGVGALNIDACRVAMSDSDREAARVPMGDWSRSNTTTGGTTGRSGTQFEPASAGRWPTNVVLTHAATPDGVDLCADGCVVGCPVRELDDQSGHSVSRAYAPRSAGGGDGWRMQATGAEYDDAGGASRFFPVFRFAAKAPASERPRVDGVAHPTVKPLTLMRWLVRLATPPKGRVLDPFAGSGTTGQACRAEGFECVLIEQNEAYLPLIRRRLDGEGVGGLFGGVVA